LVASSTVNQTLELFMDTKQYFWELNSNLVITKIKVSNIGPALYGLWFSYLFTNTFTKQDLYYVDHPLRE